MDTTPREHERLGDEIAELGAHLDAATHRFLTLIRRFDATGGFAAQGCLTCAHWLSWRVGLDLGAAREHVRVARALGALPLLDAALRAGRVSYSKVRAITRVATRESEASLLDIARSSTAAQLERVCRGLRRALRTTSGEHPEDEADLRWVRQRETEAGFVRLDVQLRVEEGAMLVRALEAAARAWDGDAVPAETRQASLRRADALVAVAETYLAARSSGDEAGPPVELVVHVEAAPGFGRDGCAAPTESAGGTLDDGTALRAATVERLACDAAVVEVVEDPRGNVLDVGRRRRTIPTLLRRALRLRDRGCRFPGCTNRRVDGHHVVPWSRGGRTSLANLASLCRRHHRFVHEVGFRLEGDAVAGFRFLDPAGRPLPPACPPPALGDAPLDALRAGTVAGGIAIDPETNLPNLDYRRPDYGHIVAGLAAAAASRSGCFRADLDV